MRFSLLVVVSFFLLAAACLPDRNALGDCSVGDTRAIVLDWEPFNPFWDEDATDSVLAALEYWGIGDEEDEVFFRRQPEVTNSPRILLSHIEDHLPGKRIAYFNTHGGADPSIVGFLAVEYYRDFDPFKDAYLAYVDRGYEQNLDIGWGVRPYGEDSAYVILLLPAGIYYHFRGLMEREGIVYGDYCWSIHNAGLWGEDTFLGYRHDTATWTMKYNMWKFWRRLSCNEVNGVARDGGIASIWKS